MKRAVEIAVVALSGLIVTATVAYLVFEGVTTGEVTPGLVVEIADVSPAESDGDAYLADVRIENEGGRSVAEARVEVTAQLTDGSTETGHITFEFVPKGSSRTGVVRFSGEPRPETARLRIVSYITP